MGVPASGVGQRSAGSAWPRPGSPALGQPPGQLRGGRARPPRIGAGTRRSFRSPRSPSKPGPSPEAAKRVAGRRRAGVAARPGPRPRPASPGPAAGRRSSVAGVGGGARQLVQVPRPSASSPAKVPRRRTSSPASAAGAQARPGSPASASSQGQPPGRRFSVAGRRPRGRAARPRSPASASSQASRPAQGARAAFLVAGRQRRAGTAGWRSSTAACPRALPARPGGPSAGSPMWLSRASQVLGGHAGGAAFPAGVPGSGSPPRCSRRSGPCPTPAGGEGGGGAVQLFGGVGQGSFEPVLRCPRPAGALVAVARRGPPRSSPGLSGGAGAEPGPHPPARGQPTAQAVGIAGRGASCQAGRPAGGAAANVWVSPYPAAPSASAKPPVPGGRRRGPRSCSAGAECRAGGGPTAGQVQYFPVPGRAGPCRRGEGHGRCRRRTGSRPQRGDDRHPGPGRSAAPRITPAGQPRAPPFQVPLQLIQPHHPWQGRLSRPSAAASAATPRRGHLGAPAPSPAGSALTASAAPPGSCRPRKPPTSSTKTLPAAAAAATPGPHAMPVGNRYPRGTYSRRVPRRGTPRHA